MSGVTRWEVVASKRSGLGARYRMLMRVGSAEMGGLVEIVECSPERDMAWSSVTGVDQRGRWRLREVGGDRTRVEFRFAYGVAGAGITGYHLRARRGAVDPPQRAALAAAAASARSSTEAAHGAIAARRRRARQARPPDRLSRPCG